MPRTPALFAGPIEFMDVGTGKQISIPLSAVSFLDGSISVDGYNNKAATDWLKYLATTGLLVPDSSPPSKPAMIITAANPGGTGNFIQITFSEFTADADPKFKVVVTETDTYKGLTIGTLPTVLGTTTIPGTHPGLVVVVGPVADIPAATVGAPLVGTLPKAPLYQAALDKDNKPLTAFSVQARGPGEADGVDTTVTIKEVDADKKTFTLVAIWSRTRTLTATEFQDPKYFGYEIKVEKPTGLPPAPGTYNLSGGSDALSLPAASASVQLVTG
jgi:hypothetical protein